MISLEKMKRVSELVDEYGVNGACEREAEEHRPISITSIKDYCRRYKKYLNDKRLAKGEAKILLFDIETDFMVNATWGLWKQNIHIGQIIKDWSMICWSAKWLFSETIYSGTVTPEESLMRDDKKATIELWKLVDEADVIIAHNLAGFDKKKMNTCFLKHDLGQPSSYQMIDTLLIARSNFAISSNKLDYLAKFFGLPMKFDTSFSLWRECDGIDAIVTEEITSTSKSILKITTYNKKVIQKALDYMVEYCKNDVSVLESIYLILRAWDKRHPNLALYGQEKGGRCYVCKGTNFVDTSPYLTPVSIYPAKRCLDCGAINHSRFAEKRDKELLRGCAR